MEKADWLGKSIMEDQDFQEEDVWGVVKEREESSKKVGKTHKIHKRSSSCVWTSSHDHGVRMTPKYNEDSGMAHHHQQSSSPKGIPDWSKVYRQKNKAPSNRCHDDGAIDDDHDVDDDGTMVPPHEYIARRLARSRITSSSMCEGVGRTLKGRDLSKLRNAILTKTGFLE